MLPKVMGKRIQKARKKIGWTQEELASKVGISAIYMGFIEQGRNAASVPVLSKIARLLKIKLSDLFD